MSDMQKVLVVIGFDADGNCHEVAKTDHWNPLAEAVIAQYKGPLVNLHYVPRLEAVPSEVRSYAVQESEATGLDACNASGDGQAMGSGDSEGQEASEEGEGEEEVQVTIEVDDGSAA